MSDTSKRDILFSIFNQSESDETINFTFQEVRRDEYFPADLRFLKSQIRDATNSIEIDRATEKFDKFVTNRKKELSTLHQQSKNWEKMNQRRIYILKDQFNDAVYNNDTKDLVFIGGSLGGGMMQLNEELTEIEENKELEFLIFDSDGIGRKTDSVTIEHDMLHTVLDIEEKEFTQNYFPITIDGYTLTLTRAYSYFEDQYQKLSMINDFSPIVDSSITATEATLQANFQYFCELPDVVLQKFDQYNLSGPGQVLDLLGVQQHLSLQRTSVDDLEIRGYAFVQDDREYALIYSDLYLGLCNFLLVQSSFEAARKYCDFLESDKDLKWQIEEFERSNRSFGKIDAANILRSSPVIKELTGLNAISRKIEKFETQRNEIEIPLGYVSFNNDDSDFVTTSFGRNHLPKEFSTIVLNIKNALDVIRTGLLVNLSFEPDNLSIYLDSPQLRIKLEIQARETDSFDLIVYLVGKYPNELLSKADESGLVVGGEILSEIQIPLSNQRWQKIKSLYDPRVVSSKEEFLYYMNTPPLTTYVDRKLSDHVVSVLLKRILKEVQDFENQLDSSSQDPFALELANFSVEKDNQTTLLQQSILDRMRQVDEEENFHVKLRELEAEIDRYNPGLYSFLVNMQRREDATIHDDVEQMYHYIKNLFHDITVAVIDFGLTPQQWRFAENLQLWSSYQAQINYIEHTITIELRELIGSGYEGKDISKLIDHPYTRQTQYESFHGNIDGDRYVNLKKVHLTFIPLLHRYKDKLEQSSDIDELVRLIEQLEKQRKERIQSQLPSLPSRKSSLSEN